jgi:hypothetical protein
MKYFQSRREKLFLAAFSGCNPVVTAIILCSNIFLEYLKEHVEWALDRAR